MDRWMDGWMGLGCPKPGCTAGGQRTSAPISASSSNTEQSPVRDVSDISHPSHPISSHPIPSHPIHSAACSLGSAASHTPLTPLIRASCFLVEIIIKITLLALKLLDLKPRPAHRHRHGIDIRAALFSPLAHYHTSPPSPFLVPHRHHLHYHHLHLHLQHFDDRVRPALLAHRQ